MGCTQSKIDNEEAVLRCKDRKQFMRSAVADRNAFAAAHFGFTVSLKNTGAALHEFGQGEVQDPVPSIQAASSVMEPTLPPPPPLPYQVPLQRAASMPELPIPKSDPKRTDTIQEEDDEFELENDDSNLIRRGGAGGRSAGRTAEVEAPPPLPSPPRNAVPNNPDPPPPLESKDNRWDYFFEPEIPRPSLSDPNEIRPDMDEGGSGVYDDRFHKKVNDVVDGDAGSKSGKVEPLMPERVVEAPVKKSKAIVNSQTAPTEAKRGGKARSNVNLSQILQELDEDFLKASESAHEVSKMLEANRLHYHSNFADNRGHIDHSARVMRVITWNRSFRGLTNADDGKDELDADEHETHASVLDKLLAWEKKLYDEVKAGELMKLEYQRKVSLLNKQKRRSTNSEALEKAKAAVSHLHTRYIVDMQSLDSTVAEINRLRDDHLYPRLVDLVDGMAKMWETMAIHHDRQLKIVADLRMLDYSHSPMETSDNHHKYTKQLCRAVGEWHMHLQKLVSYQKGYIRALNGWLKLNLIPIESSLKEKVSSPPRVHRPPIQALLLSWNEDLEKLPDDRARTSISNFSAIIEAIMHQQDEEVKLKMKCDETKKELTRKKRAFEDWHQKYKQRRTPPDEMDPEKTEDPNYQDPVIERQFVLENLEKRLEDEVETYQKHCQLVRDKSLSCLKMQLPELLRAISEFAHSCTEMYANLRSVPQSQNPTESSS